MKHSMVDMDCESAVRSRPGHPRYACRMARRRRHHTAEIVALTLAAATHAAFTLAGRATPPCKRFATQLRAESMPPLPPLPPLPTSSDMPAVPAMPFLAETEEDDAEEEQSEEDSWPPPPPEPVVPAVPNFQQYSPPPQREREFVQTGFSRPWRRPEDAGRDTPQDFFVLPQDEREGEPRALTWEEALVDFLPIGATVRGVIQELRPYGSFISLIVSGMAVGRFGEDSRIRGFCEDLQSSSNPADPQVGEHVAVKIIDVDMSTKRVFLSTSQAEPPWPATQRERTLHAPEKYDDESFFPLP
ncbi:unnamed protein product [Symbiodinium natans]|uniref:S1 motif domain-containing protein n=1 Tax=Symbiodinium natans TaxID=878477 RepID=A0A812SA86_9DINO|nr:unnamed protein product [Symbiodinium natans]